MGPKVKHAAVNKKSNSSDNVHRDAKGKGNMRSKSTIMRLNMYRRGAPVRNARGDIIGGTLLMNNKSGGKDVGDVARIAPDRRWFGNTRLISQTDLDKFRENMTVKAADPYSVVLRRQKIPMALLKDSAKVAKMNLLETEKFDACFGGKQLRKRPKLSNAIGDYAALAQAATDKAAKYDSNPSKDTDMVGSNADDSGVLDLKKDDLFSKGQSKRVWGELYKVLDCSDVVLQIVDARDVPGTRCPHIENHIRKHASHKHLVIVINKCDLVPSWVTRKWVKTLSAEFPTLAYHASINNSFGKGALISLLRQFAKLHSDKRQISVGVIGYPNCGKSSVINSLMGKKCCKAAPVPGETKVWQYIALMKRIFLIDSPGVVYDVGDDEASTVLKGVVRAERLDTPTDFIAPILARVKPVYIQRQYGISEWTDATDFLGQVALKSGRVLKGGEPDFNTIAINVINDWQRGKLPYFVAPPRSEDDDDDDDNEEENGNDESKMETVEDGTNNEEEQDELDKHLARSRNNGAEELGSEDEEDEMDGEDNGEDEDEFDSEDGFDEDDEEDGEDEDGDNYDNNDDDDDDEEEEEEEEEEEPETVSSSKKRTHKGTAVKKPSVTPATTPSQSPAQTASKSKKQVQFAATVKAAATPRAVKVPPRAPTPRAKSNSRGGKAHDWEDL